MLPHNQGRRRLVHKLSTTTATVLLLLVILTNNVTTTFASDDDDSSQQCGIYFAPSSIPNSGYGMFSGIDRPEISIIHDLPCPVFPLDNMMYAFNKSMPPSGLPVLRTYAWTNSKSHFGKNEYLGKMTIMAGNFYSLPNSHAYHNNVEMHRGDYYDGLLDRFYNPGAGAVSLHVNRVNTVHHIHQGEELFLDYGDKYFIGREDEYQKTHITRHGYEKAIRILHQFSTTIVDRSNTCTFGNPLVQFLVEELILPYSNDAEFSSILKEAFPLDSSSWIQQFSQSTAASSIDRVKFGPQLSSTILEIYNIVFEFYNETNSNNRSSSDSLDGCVRLIKDIMQVIDHRTAAALPLNEADMKYLLENGITSLEINNHERIRDIRWLQQNGICLDNIELKISENPTAGFGAVARRSLKKGTIVDAVPLMPIDDFSYFNMYELDNVDLDDEGDDEQPRKNKYGDDDTLIGHQIYMNYCFGHKKSSLLLCMISSSAWINHKTQTGQQEGANVEYRWAQWVNDPTQEALKMPLEELKRAPYRKLALEIVALRDIAQGEELYMDYGKDWETAWGKHVDEWTPPTGVFADHIPVKQVMRMNKEKLFRSLSEQKTDPYPRSTGTECYVNMDYLVSRGLYPPKDSVVPTSEELKNLHEDFSSSTAQQSIKETFAIDFEQLVNGGGNDDEYVVNSLFYSYTRWQPCDILESEVSETGASYYLVRYYNHNEHLAGIQDKPKIGDVPLIMKNVPHIAIRFTTKPFSTDRYLPGAFRHPIIMKDDLFPSHWKDLEL